jgi:hypothetical protein
MDIKIEAFVSISIYKSEYCKSTGTPLFNTKMELKNYDVPRWQYETTFFKNRISYIVSLISARNYGYFLQTSYYHYDKKTGEDVGAGSLLSTYYAQKGVLTRYKNKLKNWEDNFQPTIFIKSCKDVEGYTEALARISAKEEQVRCLEEQVKKIYKN